MSSPLYKILIVGGRWRSPAYILGLWLFLGAFVILFSPRGDLHLAINRFHGDTLDPIMVVVTWLGARYFAWSVGGVLLLTRRFRLGGAVLLATIAAGLLTELFKYVLLGEHPRPVAYFGDPSPLYRVPGFENHLTHSMPSGHTAIAFALFLVMALNARSAWQQWGLLGIAAAVAYSRVYLSEHFFEDVYAGSLLGAICGAVAFLIVRPKTQPDQTAEKECPDVVV